VEKPALKESASFPGVANDDAKPAKGTVIESKIFRDGLN
jgi:hypothetical protein